MSRLVSRAEGWERAYEAFENINFSAFDYNTVKQSIIDYIKLYFPETFNDYIESSEFIAIVETFAYIAELVSYRLDLNAHENFISTAQRRDSILRLAKLISYKVDRPIPARGLVKITSITTTEEVFDSNGINLSNTTIIWNDPTNADWKSQFITVMDRVLDQEFGTVLPTDRFQIDNVVFELYRLENAPLLNGVFPYSATTGGVQAAMELVPVEYDSDLGIIERRPERVSNFTLLYANDGLGDASDTTGFMSYTKQGTLQRFPATFDGVTPNQSFVVSVSNINETDVWLNNVDPNTGIITDEPALLPYKRATDLRTGEWVPVDLAHAQNVIFNTNPVRNKYEIETLNLNQIRLIFGDGEFADIPRGTFDIWVRTSLNQDIVISRNDVVDQTATFTYVDTFGRTQTFNFTFSLINSLQNNSAQETLEHVRNTAPAINFTQDRMVNAEDYNVFPLQDSSIVKLRAVNRTFAGDSKYITWHDPSETYENVKLFGDDGLIYFVEASTTVQTATGVSIDTLINAYIQPLLSSFDLFLNLVNYGVAPVNIRRVFNTAERQRITAALTPPPSPSVIDMYFNTLTNEWYALKGTALPTDPGTAPYYVDGLAGVGWPTDFITTSLIQASQNTNLSLQYAVTRQGRRVIFESETTRFWNSESADAVIDYDTLNSDYDKIVILAANANANRNALLAGNQNFNVLGQETVESGPNLGLSDIHRLSVVSVDSNGDNVPDNLTLSGIINPQITVTTTGNVQVQIMYITSGGLINPSDVTVVGDVNPMVQGVDWNESTSTGATASIDSITQYVNIINMNGNTSVTITVKEYVYFNRITQLDPWVPVATSYDALDAYIESLAFDTGLYKRENGRDALNFAWFHFSRKYHLIDPAASNIIDMFVITKGYFTETRRWLQDTNAPPPTVPTPQQLRQDYGYLLDNKMVSDTVIMHPGTFKLLFGPKAIPELQAQFKIIRSENQLKTDNQIKATVVSVIRGFFDTALWEFGETFFFTELAAAIHAELPTDISSVVLVPTFPTNQFGDMFEVVCREDEIFYPDISVNNIDIVASYNATNLRLNGPLDV